VAAATNIYLQIAGIPGDATAHDFVHEIQLTAYSQSVQAAVANNGSAQSARPSCGQINLVKHVDSASPRLVSAALSNTKIAQAVVSFVDTQGSNGTERIDYIVTLGNVFVTGVAQADTSPAELVENVTLTAGTIQIDYVPFKTNGTAGTPQKVEIHCDSASAT
jgi:type VI secretion system Hcp family effector